MPSSVRIELNKVGYDWDHGRLLLARDKQPPRYIQNDDAVLDRTFSNGTGMVDIPKVFARDKRALYFATFSPTHGARISRVAIDPEQYVQQRELIPYPGD